MAMDKTTKGRRARKRVMSGAVARPLTDNGTLAVVANGSRNCRTDSATGLRTIFGARRRPRQRLDRLVHRRERIDRIASTVGITLRKRLAQLGKSLGARPEGF